MVNVGIDPAKNRAVARLVDHTGKSQGRTIRFSSDRPGIERLVQRVEATDAAGEYHFFVEASGRYWYPIAGLLKQADQAVSLIAPSYTKAQRKASSRHAKSDVKDAEAIARAPFNMGDKALHPADVPDGLRLQLQLLTRERHSLEQDATVIKQRVLDRLQLTSPGLTEITGTDLVPGLREFIVKYPLVDRLGRLGEKRLTAFLHARLNKRFDPAMVRKLLDLAKTAFCPPGLDAKEIGAQFKRDFERLGILEGQIKHLDRKIGPLEKQCDPEQLARSIPGFGKVIAPILLADAGIDVSRFPTSKKFCGWTGLVAKASGTNGKQAEGLPMTKAGRKIVKWALYMAAKVAVQHDPDCKEMYERLIQNGKHYNVAINAVAHKLARIYYTVMTEQRPYLSRDKNGIDST